MVINNKIKLSKREIEVLVEIMFFNYGKLGGESPFKGEGRKEIRKSLDLSSQNYAILLNNLCSKGALIKGQGLSTYNLHYKFSELYYKIMQLSQINLSESYELIDERLD